MRGTRSASSATGGVCGGRLRAMRHPNQAPGGGVGQGVARGRESLCRGGVRLTGRTGMTRLIRPGLTNLWADQSASPPRRITVVASRLGGERNASVRVRGLASWQDGPPARTGGLSGFRREFLSWARVGDRPSSGLSRIPPPGLANGHSSHAATFPGVQCLPAGVDDHAVGWGGRTLAADCVWLVCQAGSAPADLGGGGRRKTTGVLVPGRQHLRRQ